MKLERVTYPKYYCINFLLKHGWWVFGLIAFLPVIAAVLAVSKGISPWVLAVGAVCGAVAYLLLRSFLELIQVIADFILPR